MAETSDRSDEEEQGREAEAVDAAVALESEPFCGRHLIRRQRSRRPRSGLRRFSVAAATFVASVGFLIAIVGGLAFMRLSQGPFTVDLKPQIVAALDRRVGHGYRFDLVGTAIEATDHGPALTISHLSVTDASARPIVSAPRAAISLDPMSLLVGRVAPNRLDIHDVDVRLLILPDGQVAVSTGSDDAAAFPLSSAFSGASRSVHGPGPADAAAGVVAPGGVLPASTVARPENAALRALSAAMRSLVEATTDPESALNSMQRVRVTGRLVLDDRTHGTKTVFSNTDLSFDRASNGAVTLSVAADGPGGRWSLKARASAEPDGVKTLTVEATDLSLDEITLAGGLRSVGFDFDMPVSAQLTIRLGPDGEIDTAYGNFSIGAGYFKLDDPDHEPLLIDSVAGGFHLDSTTNGVAIDRTELRAGESVFGLTGHVDLPHNPGDPWAVRADASGTFGTERPGEKPIRIAHAGMKFRVLPGERRFVVDKLDVDGPEIDFDMTSDIHAEGSGFRLKNTATVKHMPAVALVRLWPSLIAAPVRAWLLANLKGGTVETGTATSDLTDTDLALMRAEHAVTDDHVHVTFAVSNLSLAFMQGVPSLDGIEAKGVVTGRTFNMDVQKGTMDVAPGRKLTLADGNLHVPDTDPKPTPAVIEAHVLGGVDVLTELLSRDALKPYANLPPDGAAMKGQIDGHLTVATRFGDHVPPDETKIGVSATAANFGLDKLIGKEGLSDATLKLDVDKTGLHAKGDGRIYGAPATLDFRRPPTGGSEAAIAMVLDDAARARAGVSASVGLRGSVAAKITATMAPGDKTKAAVELDFTKAAMDEVVPGFSKPVGRAAKASFTVQTRDSGVTLDNIAFEGGGTSLRGSADLDKDGGFSSAHLSQVKLSPGDDLKLDAQQTGDVLKIVARGSNLDARPFLKWLGASSPRGSPSAPEPAKGALDLDLHTAILTGQNNQAITGADLRLARRGSQIKKLQLTGKFGRQAITISTASIDNAPHFIVNSGDAGASLLFMDLYKRMGGGRLDANIASNGGRLDGYATVHDFVIREDPAMRKLASEGLASQNREGANGGETPPVDLSAMQFTKLEAYFTKTGSTVQVRDGSMFGNQLGATVGGTIDFNRDQVNLSGTFVPLYGVNNLFSQVPLFGPLLGGGRHEGLLGLNYRITGSAASPVLNVNPLSALAPGFLRQIFGALDSAAEGEPQPRDRADGPGRAKVEQE